MNTVPKFGLLRDVCWLEIQYGRSNFKTTLDLLGSIFMNANVVTGLKSLLLKNIEWMSTIFG